MTTSLENGKLPFLGFGLGLRPEHYEEIVQQNPAVEWFEIITENYLIPGGKPLYYLDKIRQDYPLVMHGVSLSIASKDPLDWEYLRQVKELANRIEAKWISDHLCWTGINGLNMHDLLPVPYTEEAIDHIIPRIRSVQDYLGRPILIENVSSYLSFHESEMTEWEFIAEIAEQADCHLLLDVNNIYVSSVNHQFNPLDYLRGVPRQRVAQIHLAGHSNYGDYIIDTHDAPVCQEVWQLYAQSLQYFGVISTMIERDDNIPSLNELIAELNQAKEIATAFLAKEPAL
ncbi:MNIO family bufferin maturase [Legionella jordanis]|uniref:UPF0276 protein Ljor_2632 n=1 Tax=Legionella jordanis TaxID=456 RepID=A0A0W0VEU2_9GAMM|nr:DUF692 domain-containing protein [Legionella jordanis]KTD18326.1 hypothetical protein Ljor_2632 [Legionella jordanis]RMX05242.1 DUF692 domain-containing protein [Legionella jordanis]VEH13328.1 Protein of uncharacterised function (DUF692) [Legionella jordanis]HAT8713674.1 DUF692 family protein [Legionella jordanis]